MNVPDILNKVQAFMKVNSPAILTGTALAGTISTGVLAAQGGMRAGVKLYKLQTDEEIINLTPKEKFLETWRFYVPALASGATTLLCIATAHSISNKQTAAYAAAYSLSEGTLKEYKDKIIEKLGEKEETKIREEIAADRVAAAGPTTMIVGEGKIVAYEALSGRYFETTVEKLKQAEIKLNRELLHDDQVTLSDWYSAIGLKPTRLSEQLGWNNTRPLQLHLTSALDDNDKPVLHVGYISDPFLDYYRPF